MAQIADSMVDRAAKMLCACITDAKIETVEQEWSQYDPQMKMQWEIYARAILVYANQG